MWEIHRRDVHNAWSGTLMKCLHHIYVITAKVLFFVRINYKYGFPDRARVFCFNQCGRVVGWDNLQTKFFSINVSIIQLYNTQPNIRVLVMCCPGRMESSCVIE